MSLAPLDLLRLTYRSLRGNPLRSTLTMLGIFMGVAAVSATLQVGAISRAVIAQQLADRDAPQVTVIPRWVPGVGQRVTLQTEDLEFLRQRLSRSRAISALKWVGSTNALFRDREAQPTVMAVTQDFWSTSDKTLVAGRWFTAADFSHYRPVVVIDQFLATHLFEGQNPIGQRIYASQQPYTVVGIVTTSSFDGEPPSGEFFMTMAWYQALYGDRSIGQLKIRPQSLEDLTWIAEQTEHLLLQRFPGEQFWVWNNVEDILQRQDVLRLTSRSLAAVGAIALLVGGVGIANIMIASVTERTSEIGLRRAIGATRSEIMMQFILEASLLSLMSGTTAIASVHGITLTVAHQFNLPYQFEPQTAVLSLGAALGVGISASFLPALRASQLDPVKALRSE